MKRIKVFCISILVVSLSFLPLSSSATSYTKDYKIMNSPTATKQQIKDWAEKQNAYHITYRIGYSNKPQYALIYNSIEKQNADSSI